MQFKVQPQFLNAIDQVEKISTGYRCHSPFPPDLIITDDETGTGAD